MLVDFGSFPLLAPVPNPQAASLCLPLARPQRSQIVIVRSLTSYIGDTQLRRAAIGAGPQRWQGDFGAMSILVNEAARVDRTKQRFPTGIAV